MIAWILVIALAGGWAYYNSGEFSFKPIIMVTTLPVPTAYLTSLDIWHRSFCQPGPGQKCSVCPTVDLTDEDMLRLVPQREIDKFNDLVDMYLDNKPQFTRLKQFKRVDFGCCWNTEPWQYGYAIAESVDTWITWEMSTEELQRTPPVFHMRIAGISKKHCLAPPIMPFGDVVMQGARSYATWPDHHHYWIHHFDAPHGRIPKDGVAVWDRSEQPWRPKVTYSLKRVARRLVNPLPVYTFNAKAMQLAHMASGLKQQKQSSNVPNKALRDMIVDIRKVNQETMAAFTDIKLQFDALKISQTNLQHILTPITHLAVNNKYTAVHSLLSDLMHKVGTIHDVTNVTVTELLSSPDLERLPVLKETIIKWVVEEIKRNGRTDHTSDNKQVGGEDNLAEQLKSQQDISASLLKKVSDIQMRIEESNPTTDITAILNAFDSIKERVGQLEQQVTTALVSTQTPEPQDVSSQLAKVEDMSIELVNLQNKLSELADVHSKFSRYMVNWSAPYSAISSLIWTLMFLSDKHQLNVKWYTHVSTPQALCYLEDGYEGPPDNLIEQDLSALAENTAWAAVLNEKVAIYEHGTRFVISMFGPTEKNATLLELLDEHHVHHKTVFY